MTGRALVVVTRVASNWRGIPTEAWVASREALLDQVCAQGIRGATVPLAWVWRSCPERWEQVREMADRIYPDAHVVASGRGDQDHETANLDAIAPDARRFVTARIDSDDAYLPDTLDRLATMNLPADSIVNYSHGWQFDWSSGRLANMGWDNPNQQGPFLAVTHESRDGMLGVGGNHATESRWGRRVIHEKRRSWVQVVHGENIKNAWRGQAEPHTTKDRDAVLARARIEWRKP